MKIKIRILLISFGFAALAGGVAYASMLDQGETNKKKFQTEIPLATKRMSIEEKLPPIEKDIPPVETPLSTNVASQPIPNTVEKSEPVQEKKNEPITVNKTQNTNTNTQVVSKEQQNQGSTEPVVDEKPAYTIEINGVTYYNLMDRGLSEHLMKVADKHGIVYYGILNSDIFIIVKDGNPIITMTTGNKSSNIEYKDILIDLYSDHGEYFTLIAEGINQVVQTGGTVIVKNIEGTYWEISKEENVVKVELTW